MAKGRKKPERYRRRRRLRLLYQMLSVLLILAAVIAGCVVFFQVEHVTVEGSSRYSEEQILAVADVDENANLLPLPRRAIASRIAENYAYVDQVSVQRDFPTTVRIVIEECVPTASVETDGVFWIIDEKGKILDSAEESVANTFIKVNGVTLVEPEIGKAAQVAEEEAIIFKGLCGVLTALHEQELTKFVTWVDLSDKTEIDLDYQGRFTVRLPVTTEYNEAQKRTEGYSLKIAALVEMVKLLDMERGTIDLRNSDGRFLPG